MLAKRIIPCLDIRNGQTVKGVNFVGIREVGDPVELGAEYAREGADELVFLDITATHEGRKTFASLVERIALRLDIPFTVGGGISELGDADVLLAAGADKVSVNSAAVRRPELVSELASHFGSQFVTVAIDARQIAGGGSPGTAEADWAVTVSGGRIETDRHLYEWAHEAQERGAGEILFTSMDHDGTKQGFALAALARLSTELSIPVIASGGAGAIEHFAEAFTTGMADAGLAASIFHFHQIAIPDLKRQLANDGIPIRLD